MLHLLQPLETGQLFLKNRLIMPPMATSKADTEGHVSQAILDYYDEKSKGGFLALIIIEHSFVLPQGQAHAGQLSVADDSTIDGLKELSTLIHHNGSKAVMQINHAGSATQKSITGYEAVGPSAVAHPRVRLVPKALSLSEIKTIVEAFKAAAVRAQKAGFDGVEIHAAHGYLLSQFFSPLTNHRSDEYGGALQGRIKIHLEIIKAIREAVGDDFPILLRLGASDYMDGGCTLADSKVAAREFESAGVDMLDISGGFRGFMVPGQTQEGYFSPLSEGIKAVVSLPVILTGGITTVTSAETLLSEGKADLIGVGRAIFKDSKWAENAIKSLS